MGHYSNNPGHVRVDQFNSNGYWQAAWQVNMSNLYNIRGGISRVTWAYLGGPRTALEVAIINEIAKQIGTGDREEAIEFFKRWTWVAISPHHYYSNPIMFPAVTT